LSFSSEYIEILEKQLYFLDYLKRLCRFFLEIYTSVMVFIIIIFLLFSLIVDLRCVLTELMGLQVATVMNVMLRGGTRYVSLTWV